MQQYDEVLSRLGDQVFGRDGDFKELREYLAGLPSSQRMEFAEYAIRKYNGWYPFSDDLSDYSVAIGFSRCFCQGCGFAVKLTSAELNYFRASNGDRLNYPTMFWVDEAVGVTDDTEYERIVELERPRLGSVTPFACKSCSATTFLDSDVDEMKCGVCGGETLCPHEELRRQGTICPRCEKQELDYADWVDSNHPSFPKLLSRYERNLAHQVRFACERCGSTFETAPPAGETAFRGNELQPCGYCFHVQRLPAGESVDLKQREPRESSARELHFIEARLGFYFHLDFVRSLTHPDVQKATLGFRMKVLQLMSLLQMPYRLIYFARNYEHEFVEAQNEVGDQVSSYDYFFKHREKVADRTKERLLAWAEKGARRFPDRYDDESKLPLLHSLLADSTGTLWSNFEDILILVIKNAWDAFEVLVDDLWRAVMKAKPEKWTTLVAPLDAVIVQGGEQEGVPRLNRIRAFCRGLGNDELVELIGRPSVDATCQLHRVLVYGRGYVDDEFHWATAGAPSLSSYHVGERVRIDGDMVDDFVEPVITQVAATLIRAVHDWLGQAEHA